MKLEYVERLGRLLRKDGLDQLGVGTPRHIEQLIGAGRAEEAKQATEYLRLGFQTMQDVLVQYIQDLLAFIAGTFGEEHVEAALRSALAEDLKAHNQSYSGLSWEEKLQVTAEGMRCHLAGPERQGDFTILDEKDRLVLKWDPCGSGGALRRNAAARGLEVKSASEAHPWTWGKKGVCLYCSHCSLMNEILPIEQSGYPQCITEYPENPGDPCTWYLYKDPDDIPEEYYRRVGKTKPPRKDQRS